MMAGLLARQAAQGAKQQAPEQAPEQGVQQADPAQQGVQGGLQQEKPTPEEQKAFDKVEIAAKATIYEKKVFQKLTKMLQDGANEPAKTLAKVALMVFSIVDEKSGGRIPETVMLRGAEVTLDLVIKMAEDTGIMQVDEKMAEQALYEMIVQAGELYGFDTAELHAALGVNQGGADTQAPAGQGEMPVDQAGGQENVVTG